MRTAYLKSREGGVLLSVKVQPRALANEICEPIGNELKIKITAPPVDSAANQALVEFLANRLQCAKSAVQILRGHTSRHKTIFIAGTSVSDVQKRLEQD